MSGIPHHTGDISTTKKTIDNKFFICGKHLWLLGAWEGGGGGAGASIIRLRAHLLVHIYPLFYINLHVKYRSNMIKKNFEFKKKNPGAPGPPKFQQMQPSSQWRHMYNKGKLFENQFFIDEPKCKKKCICWAI